MLIFLQLFKGGPTYVETKLIQTHRWLELPKSEEDLDFFHLEKKHTRTQKNTQCNVARLAKDHAAQSRPATDRNAKG